MRDKYVKPFLLLLVSLVGIAFFYFLFTNAGATKHGLPLPGRKSSDLGTAAPAPHKNGVDRKPLGAKAGEEGKRTPGSVGARIRLGKKPEGNVLQARPLEVRLYCVKEGKEFPASGGTVFARPPDSDGKVHPPGKKGKKKVFSSWSFPCDQDGRAFLPLAGLAGKGHAGGVSFKIWGESKDGKYAAPEISVGLDDFGRYRLDFFSPSVYLKGVLKLRMREKATVRIRVKDEYGKPVEGVPVGIFSCIRPLNRHPGGATTLIPLRLGKTGKEGICLLTLPVGERKGFWTFLTRRVAAGFPFPLSHLDRWFKKITLKEGGKKEVVLVIAKDPSGRILDPSPMGIKNEAGARSMVDPSKKGLVLLRRIGDTPEIEVFYPGYKSRRIRCKGSVVEILLEPLQGKPRSRNSGAARK